MKLTTHLQQVPRSRIVELYLHLEHTQVLICHPEKYFPVYLTLLVEVKLSLYLIDETPHNERVWRSEDVAPPFLTSSRDSSVCIATGCGLDGRGLILRRGGRDSSLLHNVQTGPGTYPVSYPMRIEGCFPEDKAAGA
jgi:hypothetical protein